MPGYNVQSNSTDLPDISSLPVPLGDPDASATFSLSPRTLYEDTKEEVNPLFRPTWYWGVGDAFLHPLGVPTGLRDEDDCMEDSYDEQDDSCSEYDLDEEWDDEDGVPVDDTPVPLFGPRSIGRSLISGGRSTPPSEPSCTSEGPLDA